MRKRIYLDYAATTPVDPRVFKAMSPYFSKKFGNTMSFHSFGQEAKAALEESRQIMADSLGAKPEEIIFTGSATESNNLALKGTAFVKTSAGRKSHIIISPIEHDCVLESAKWLASQGFEVTKLPVDKYGLISPADVARTIKPETILVSVIHASNEIGVIQDIAAIGKICHTYRQAGREKGVLFHTDAVQSFGKIPIDVNSMDIDLLTASSHKIYGPKGAALLFIKRGVRISPIFHGGGHESGLRSSTVNVPAIVGFAKAVQIYQKEWQREARRLTKLRDKLIKGALLKIPGTYLNGHPTKRLPNNVNFRFDRVEGESIVIQLDLRGVAAATGSACSSAKLEPSHVLLALGLKPEQAHGSLRLSLGRYTKEDDINYVLKILPEIVKNLRKISPFK